MAVWLRVAVMATNELLTGAQGNGFFFLKVRRHVHDKRGDFGEKRLGGRTETGSLSPLAFLYFSFLSFLSPLGLWDCDDTAVLCTHVFYTFSLKRALFFVMTYCPRSHSLEGIASCKSSLSGVCSKTAEMLIHLLEGISRLQRCSIVRPAFDDTCISYLRTASHLLQYIFDYSKVSLDVDLPVGYSEASSCFAFPLRSAHVEFAQAVDAFHQLAV